MASNNNIVISDLDFDEIKENLKNTLKAQTQFSDYDFDGSNMSILLDLLASTTHYSSFYAHMINNESHIDSASLRSSLTSKGKLVGYTPNSVKSATAVIQITVSITIATEPADRRIIIPRGTPINSNNNSNDSRTFILIDDLIIYNQSTTGGLDYTSPEFEVFEGSFDNKDFIVNSTIFNQKFIIQDENIDIETLSVQVFGAAGDTNFTLFNEVGNVMSVKSDSPVFFISTQSEGLYEIQFGNDVYGLAVQNNNMIRMNYISSSGEDGNNSKSFLIPDFTYNSVIYPMTITTISSSSGGSKIETIDELRRNIPNHFRMQNRAVLPQDYRDLVVANYRNVGSINVYSGEDAVPPVFGRLFISIKPKFGEVLSSQAKNHIIENILKPKNVTTVPVEIIDPEFLYLNVTVSATFNPLNTIKGTGQITTEITNTINLYDTTILNQFDGLYSNFGLNTQVRAVDSAIFTSFITVQMEKRFTITPSTTTYSIEFGSVALVNSIKSETFTFRERESFFTDDGDGNIIIFGKDSVTNVVTVFTGETFGTVDYSTGIINLSKFSVTSTNGIISVVAKSNTPDFYSKQNTIVTINDIAVTVTPQSGNPQ